MISELLIWRQWIDFLKCGKSYHIKMNVENRTIFEGDNPHILRELDSETIDPIYLNPPFNSNKTYEAPIGSAAAGAAFKDAWTLSNLDNAWHGELAEHEPRLHSDISAAEFTRGICYHFYTKEIHVVEESK